MQASQAQSQRKNGSQTPNDQKVAGSLVDGLMKDIQKLPAAKAAQEVFSFLQANDPSKMSDQDLIKVSKACDQLFPQLKACLDPKLKDTISLKEIEAMKAVYALARQGDLAAEINPAIDRAISCCQLRAEELSRKFKIMDRSSLDALAPFSDALEEGLKLSRMYKGKDGNGRDRATSFALATYHSTDRVVLSNYNCLREDLRTQYEPQIERLKDLKKELQKQDPNCKSWQHPL